MNSAVTQRFINCFDELVRENKLKSARQFAISIGALPQSLNEILKGRRDVTVEMLRKAIEIYEMNPYYLFMGEGDCFSKDTPHTSNPILTVVTNNQQEERIVHVPVPAQAGYGAQLADPVFMQELPAFSLPDFRFKHGTFRSFDVQGDSMEPTLYEGDKVVCSFLEPDSWASSIKDNYVYIIITAHEVVVKRVINEIRNKGSIILLSDNNYYQERSFPIEAVKEVWLLQMKISPFMPSPSNIRNALHEDVEGLKNQLQSQSELIQSLNKTIEKLLKHNRSFA
jgi:signal peptidase I